MKKYIKNGTILTPKERIENSVLVFEDGIIQKIIPSDEIITNEENCIDAKGLYICPGFIDIHFHGAMDKDTMDADVVSLQIMSEFCAVHGVTLFYPTTWSALPADILEAIKCIARNKDKVNGARIEGVHVEGPYLDMIYRGAQLPEMVRKPDKTEYEAWIETGIIKIITCAPELEESSEFIKSAVANGIRISIGHSQATYEQVFAVADLGASQATHIFNGMTGLHHRDPGTVGGILDNEKINAQLICDGVHLHPAVVRLIYKTKSISKMILITDSIRGAGLPDGDYLQKGQKIIIRKGIARTPEGGLSGSTLTMDQAIRNLIAFTGVSIEEAISTVTQVPATEMGISDKKGKIAVGHDADIVFLDKKLNVIKTMVGGKIVYSREKNE